MSTEASCDSVLSKSYPDFIGEISPPKLLQQYQEILEFANTLSPKVKMAVVSVLLTTLMMFTGSGALASSSGDLACPPQENHFAVGRPNSGSQQDAVVECHEDGFPDNGRLVQVVFPDSTHQYINAPSGLKYLGPDGKYFDMILIPNGACSVRVFDTTGYSIPIDPVLGTVSPWGPSWGDKLYQSGYNPSNCDSHSPTPTPNRVDTPTPIPTQTAISSPMPPGTATPDQKSRNFLPHIVRSEQLIPSPTPTPSPTLTPQSTPKPVPRLQAYDFQNSHLTVSGLDPNDELVITSVGSLPTGEENVGGNFKFWIKKAEGVDNPDGSTIFNLGLPEKFYAFIVRGDELIQVHVDPANRIIQTADLMKYDYNLFEGTLDQPIGQPMSVNRVALDEGGAGFLPMERLVLQFIDKELLMLLDAYGADIYTMPDSKLHILVTDSQGKTISIPMGSPQEFAPRISSWEVFMNLEEYGVEISNCVSLSIEYSYLNNEGSQERTTWYFPLVGLNGEIRTNDPSHTRDDQFCPPYSNSSSGGRFDNKKNGFGEPAFTSKIGTGNETSG